MCVTKALCSLQLAHFAGPCTHTSTWLLLLLLLLLDCALQLSRRTHQEADTKAAWQQKQEREERRIRQAEAEKEEEHRVRIERHRAVRRVRVGLGRCLQISNLQAAPLLEVCVVEVGGGSNHREGLVVETTPAPLIWLLTLPRHAPSLTAVLQGALCNHLQPLAITGVPAPACPIRHSSTARSASRWLPPLQRASVRRRVRRCRR